LRPFTNGTPAFSSPGCTVSHCRCLSRSSRFRCSGIRGWMVIRHIVGFVAAFVTPAQSRSRLRVLPRCEASVQLAHVIGQCAPVRDSPARFKRRQGRPIKSNRFVVASSVARLTRRCFSLLLQSVWKAGRSRCRICGDSYREPLQAPMARRRFAALTICGERARRRSDRRLKVPCGQSEYQGDPHRDTLAWLLTGSHREGRGRSPLRYDPGYP